jgi:predicted metal-dependent HD superfamily phosphohydrolase
MPNQDDVTKKRAARYWRRLAARLALADGIFDRLVTAYGEPHRRYHILAHIVEMLDCLKRSRRLAVNRDALELAIWFHDVVYDSAAAHGANETASADLLSELCPVDAAKPARAMVLHSSHHGPTDDLDTRLFCDLDLYRLAGSLETFLRHGDDVRHEYASVDDDAWASGRAVFLGGILRRPVIYQTDYWRDRLEQEARSNIAHVLDGPS